MTCAGGALLVLTQALVTGYASERRVTREYLAHARLEHALKERSTALNLVSESSRELEHALEQVQRQSAVKALFLGTMSHELRTPLHGILGLTELVQRQSSDHKVVHHLSLIRSSGTHLLELIGALLDVSRIDAGRLEIHSAPFDLVLEIRSMADLYELRAETKGIAFRAAIEIGDSCWVHADAARVRQILHNLLGNAVKFTKRGWVGFSATQVKGVFHFEVTDTGPGIAVDELPHIFEAFRQAGDSAAKPADGTGLGLTIARELARAMQGDIIAASAPGVGSRFDFAVAFAPSSAPDVPGPSTLSDDQHLQLRAGCRVLLVEDNDVNALIAKAHLDSLASEVVRAHDGRQAVDVATSARRPDIVLMDCRMPIMDGFAATRAIRSWENRTGASRVPIIALTATPRPEDRAECLDAGMDGFLAKPFTACQLFEAISMYRESGSIAGPIGDTLYEFAVALEDSEDFIPNTTMH